MSRVVTAGRHDSADLEALFAKSENFQTKGRLNHTPFLVFLEDADAKTKESIIQVHIVDNVESLLTFSDDTKVMCQWRGKQSSDFFQFTVGQYRAYTLLLSNKET